MFSLHIVSSFGGFKNNQALKKALHMVATLLFTNCLKLSWAVSYISIYICFPVPWLARFHWKLNRACDDVGPLTRSDLRRTVLDSI